jgi:hypothetical protein
MLRVLYIVFLSTISSAHADVRNFMARSCLSIVEAELVLARTHQPAFLWAGAGAASLKCDDDELAKCLKGADDEFEECEDQCKNDFPNGGGKYNDCRNDCRDTRDLTRQGCYTTWCTDADRTGGVNRLSHFRPGLSGAWCSLRR